jgi:hypothetical protein
MRSINDLTNDELGRAMRKLLVGTESQGGVDLDLLQRQKVDILPINQDPDDDALNGIVGFLDAFQDICADDLGIWEFPNQEEE